MIYKLCLNEAVTFFRLYINSFLQKTHPTQGLVDSFGKLKVAEKGKETDYGYKVECQRQRTYFDFA